MSELESSGNVVWPKWCYSAMGQTTVSAGEMRLKRAGWESSDKEARSSPPQDRSPSSSPGSMSSSLRDSPGSAPGQMTPPRSYSDIIRGLAAKYNNDSKSYAPPPMSFVQRNFDTPGYIGSKPAESINFKSVLTKTEMSPPSSQRDAVSPLLPVVPPHMTPFQGLPMLDVLAMCRSSGLATSASDYHHHLAASARSHQLQHPAQISRLKRSRTADVVPPAGTSPLDLSNIKRARTGADSGFRDLFGPRRTASPKQETQISPRSDHSSACSQTPCSPEGHAVAKWSVEDVVSFVRTIDECAQYAELFEEHRICGSSLAMLQTEHLTNILGLKLGPALRFRAALNSRIGFCDFCSHCNHCHNSATARETAIP